MDIYHLGGIDLFDVHDICGCKGVAIMKLTKAREDFLWKIINDLYSMSGGAAGGLAHITLDDNNIEDDDLEFCIDKCIEACEENDGMPEDLCDKSPGLVNNSLIAVLILRCLTMTDREKTLGIDKKGDQ